MESVMLVSVREDMMGRGSCEMTRLSSSASSAAARAVCSATRVCSAYTAPHCTLTGWVMGNMDTLYTRPNWISDRTDLANKSLMLVLTCPWPSRPLSHKMSSEYLKKTPCCHLCSLLTAKDRNKCKATLRRTSVHAGRLIYLGLILNRCPRLPCCALALLLRTLRRAERLQRSHP